MTSAANTLAQIAARGPAGNVGRSCPECGQTFVAAHPRQIFCCAAHKKAWETRNGVRARQLYPFAVVARLTRAGTRGDNETGRRAHADADQLIQLWRDQDAAAGRMSAVDYLARRYRLGFERQ